MSLKPALQRELKRIRAGGSAGSIRLELEGGCLRSQLHSVDQIGCALETLTVDSTRLTSASVDELKRLGKDLAGRLSYLLEPLRFFEADDQSCAVQLRSAPPSRQGREAAYFEIVARQGGTVDLRRYEKRPGQARRQVPAQVTGEVFVKLVKDMVEAIGETIA